MGKPLLSGLDNLVVRLFPALALLNLPAGLQKEALATRDVVLPRFSPARRHGLLRKALAGLPDVQDEEDQGKPAALGGPGRDSADGSGQCDETKPTCTQCAKSRRQCPGYKDDFDLVFRNETKATERRAQKANRKALAQKLGRHSPEATFSLSSPRDGPSGRPSHAGSAIIPALAVPPEQLASCHFLANFVLVPRQDNGGRGFMDYLLPLIKSELPTSSLVHAYKACAFASLGNRVTSNGVNFAECALSEYTKALAATTVALRDPEASKSDGALAAVLLLGFFEVRLSETHQPPVPPRTR